MLSPVFGPLGDRWGYRLMMLAGLSVLSAGMLAVGVDPHGAADEPDFSGLRYGKVIVMTDADVDGGHIQALLLTFFFRHMRPLIEGGYIYVAQPPLYRVDAAKETYWALDEKERDRILAKLPGELASMW